MTNQDQTTNTEREIVDEFRKKFNGFFKSPNYYKLSEVQLESIDFLKSAMRRVREELVDDICFKFANIHYSEKERNGIVHIDLDRWIKLITKLKKGKEK